MYGLNNKEKLDFIVETSKKLQVTAYEFGEKTELSTVGAHNILTRASKNPRAKNLNLMIEYLQDKVLGENINRTEIKKTNLDEDKIPSYKIVDYITHNHKALLADANYKNFIDSIASKITIKEVGDIAGYKLGKLEDKIELLQEQISILFAKSVLKKEQIQNKKQK
jgi:hypothetical protein